MSHASCPALPTPEQMGHLICGFCICLSCLPSSDASLFLFNLLDVGSGKIYIYILYTVYIVVCSSIYIVLFINKQQCVCSALFEEA